MTFGSGDVRPEIPAATATKRTFYVERYGAEYRLVSVIEPGVSMDQTTVDSLMAHALSTSPDERIIAEQTISIVPADKSRDGHVHIAADTPENAEQTLRSMDAILRGGQIIG